MGRLATRSNIQKGKGAIHINDGYGNPLCGAAGPEPKSGGAKRSSWKATPLHATCGRCMPIQRDIDAAAATLAQETGEPVAVPEQRRKRAGVPGHGANGAPRNSLPTTGYTPDEPVATDVLVADEPTADHADLSIEEQTEMTNQQAPVQADTAADARPNDTTAPVILDLGKMFAVEQTTPTFEIKFSAPGAPGVELLVVVEAPDKQTALVKALKSLTWTVTEQSQQTWMGGGEA